MTYNHRFATLFELMATEIESKIYELTYHINPDLEEAEVGRRANELNDLITRGGGAVLVSRELKKIHLSYPVKNKNYSYFGVVDFTALPETIEKLNTEMKLQNSILRYLLMAKPTGKELRILGQYRPRRVIKTHEPAPIAEAAKKPAKEKTEAEKQQLEQEVEKIIENL